MTNTEMYAIEVEHPPMLLQSTLTPRVKLLSQALVEPTDGTGTGRHSHQGLGHVADFVGARASHEHLGQALGHLRLIAAIALEDLGVELALAISWDLYVLDPTRGGDQVAAVEAIAIPIALGTTLAPPNSDQRVKLFAHHSLQHH